MRECKNYFDKHSSLQRTCSHFNVVVNHEGSSTLPKNSPLSLDEFDNSFKHQIFANTPSNRSIQKQEKDRDDKNSFSLYEIIKENDELKEMLKELQQK